MKYFLIIFFLFLFISCERDTSTYQNSEAECINLRHGNQGIYFPKYYIEKLFDLRSHFRASAMFNRLQGHNPNAIVVFENEIMFVYNFHEGVTVSIIEIDENELVLDRRHHQRVFTIDNYTIKNENGLMFVNVHRELYNWRTNMTKYVASAIFGDEVFRNTRGDEIFILETGNISFAGIEYELQLNFVFFNREYDVLINKASSPLSHIFFRVYNNEINIYELAAIGEEGPMWAILGEYRLIDVFERCV